MRELLGDEGTPTENLSAERERVLHLRLREMVRATPRIETIWVWNADGRLLANSLSYPAPPDLSAAGRSFFTFHKRPGGGLHVSEATQERGDSEPLIYLTRRREGNDGRFLGVIVIGVALRTFEDFYRDLVRDGSLTLALLRGDGRVLASYPAVPSAGGGERGERGEPGAPQDARTGRRDPPTGISDASLRNSPLAPVFGLPARLATRQRVASLPLFVTAFQTQDRAFGLWLGSLLGIVAQTGAIGGALGLLGWLTLRARFRAERLQGMLQDEANRRIVAEDGLHQARKLEAVGQLTGGLAHDFNNLLMVVSTNLHILKLKGRDELFAREAAAIERAVAGGQSLTRQLMAFSRRRAQQVEVVDLNAQLPLICDLIRHSLRPGITLEAQIATHTWLVEVDVSELELALLNVAVNARDALTDGGRIEIQVANLLLDGSLDPVDALIGEFVGIQVRDSGQGMSGEVLERVFEPFFTTKDEGKGTGLGLPQVYSFARDSGGSVMIASRVGEGTTVTLFLPRAGGVQGTPVRRRRKILLVDSSTAVADSIASLLDQLGYDTQPCYSGLQALETLTGGSGGAGDLVLIDAGLEGGMTSGELVRVLRSRFPSLPLLLMSGYGPGDPRSRELGLTALAKPFDVDLLTRTLEERLGPCIRP